MTAGPSMVAISSIRPAQRGQRRTAISDAGRSAVVRGNDGDSRRLAEEPSVGEWLGPDGIHDEPGDAAAGGPLPP